MVADIIVNFTNFAIYIKDFMDTENAIFSRAERLLGCQAMERLNHARVIIFGVGGVGSWCAEALVRTGISHLTIVDSDRVSLSNINRQLMATTETVGQVKVDALKQRLLQINPSADICSRQEIFCAETAHRFSLDSYDYIVDCIDSLKDKALLILMATRSKARFYSSMGAALKLDPLRVKTGEFRTVKGCPLARALRHRFKRSGQFPSRKFTCVYSDELLDNKGPEHPGERCPGPAIADGPGDPELLNHNWNEFKACINGSLMHITSLFGITLAGLIIKRIVAQEN